MILTTCFDLSRSPSGFSVT